MSEPTISPFPVVPLIDDTPEDFDSKAFSFLGHLPTFRAEANALGTHLEGLVATASGLDDEEIQAGIETTTALRNALMGSTGYFFAWNCRPENANGSIPVTNPAKPARVRWWKGALMLKTDITWSDDAVTRVVMSYSSDTGATWTVLKAGLTNGYCDFSYDLDGNLTAVTWS